jgi:hypothetical protein
MCKKKSLLKNESYNLNKLFQEYCYILPIFHWNEFSFALVFRQRISYKIGNIFLINTTLPIFNSYLLVWKLERIKDHNQVRRVFWVYLNIQRELVNVLAEFLITFNFIFQLFRVLLDFRFSMMTEEAEKY